MSEDKRAEMLQKAMDQLREKYPAASSQWIRTKAEAIVEKKYPSSPAEQPSSERGGVVMPAIDLDSETTRPPIHATGSTPDDAARQPKVGDSLLWSSYWGNMGQFIFGALAGIGWLGWFGNAMVVSTADSDLSTMQITELLGYTRNWMLFAGIFSILWALDKSVEKVVKAIEKSASG